MHRLFEKRWDYFYVVSRNTMFLESTLVNIGYACQFELRLVDFSRKHSQHFVVDIPLIYCYELDGPAHNPERTYTYSDDTVSLSLKHEGNESHITKHYYIEYKDSQGNFTKFDFHTARAAGHPSLSTITQQKGYSFFNLKEYLAPARGFISTDSDSSSRHHSNIINEESSATMFDISRGVLPYVSSWQLISAVGWVS